MPPTETKPLFRDLEQVMLYVCGCQPVISKGFLVGMTTSSDARSKERMEGEVESYVPGPGLRGYDRAAQVGMILHGLADRLPSAYQLHLVACYGNRQESDIAVNILTTHALDRVKIDAPRKMVAYVVRRFYGMDVSIGKVAVSVYGGDPKKARFRGYHVSSKVGAELVANMAAAESMATSILKEMGVL